MGFKYPKTSHERVLEATFKNFIVSDFDNKDKLRCVVVCFVNRSGSNYLAELLRSTGRFTGLEESLNDYSMQSLAPAYGASSFSEYLTSLYHRQTERENQLWAFKAGWMQLAMLLRTKAIPNLLNPQLLLIRRRDVIGQAISFYIAERTNQWASSDPKTAGNNAVRYDGAAILRAYRMISDAYSLFDQVITLAQLKFTTIYYEDVVRSPDSLVSSISRELLGEEVLPRVEAVQIKVQRTKLNDEFREKFSEDLKGLEWSAVDATR